MLRSRQSTLESRAARVSAELGPLATGRIDPERFATLLFDHHDANPAATEILKLALGVTNASFVAQTGDWLPAHLYATLQAAFRHHGLAFVRILQRCPQYTTDLFETAMRDPGLVELMVHPNGVVVPELDRIFKNQVRHDPADLDAGRRLAEPDGKIRLGVFYRNETLPVYEETRTVPLRSASEKLALLNQELDRYAV